MAVIAILQKISSRYKKHFINSKIVYFYVVMIEKVFIISFIVFAIHATMEDGMIFEFIQDWYWKATKNWDETKADFWAKPIFGCVICQTFWYGWGLYLILFNTGFKDGLIIVLSAMGVNTIFSKLFPNG